MVKYLRSHHQNLYNTKESSAAPFSKHLKPKLMRSTLCSLLMCLCTLPLFAQGDTLTFTFADQGYDRSYIVYVPEAYDGTEEWPVVFNFHGYSINASVQMLWTGMNTVADTAHFLLVYPNGLLMRNTNPALAPQGPGWNAGSDSDTVFFSAQPVHEPTFVSNLIDQVAANFNVDLRRVYTTGWSNGGMQSTVLACELSDRIAAAAPIGAAGDEGRPCNPERIMPILYTHGTADPLVNYQDGGANPNFWGIPDYLNFWADLKGCAAVPDTVMVPDTDTTDSSTVEIITWNDCSSPLIHHRIVGGGHTWSGGAPLPEFLGPVNRDIHASSEIWNFFNRFSLPAPAPSLGEGTYHDLVATVGDTTRQYTLYEPPGYDGSEDLPVVFLFHGYATPVDTMIKMAQMYLVADTADFFVVYPQGLVVEDFNFGGADTGWLIPISYGGEHDDVAFVNQMIDDLDANPSFTIDLDRIHATGWSNGGEFSYHLACTLSDRIASVASVANPLSDTILANVCTPERPISTMLIMGSSDIFFPFDGAGLFTSPRQTTAFWTDLNGCDTMVTAVQLPDLDTSDQTTVTMYTYNDCDDDLEVLSYEIDNGGHVWPGGYLPPQWSFLGAVNRDMHASVEVWNFFNRNPLPDPLVDTREIRSEEVDWQVYPNPFRNQIQVGLSLTQKANVTVSLQNLLGQPVWQSNRQQLPAGDHHLAYELQKQLPEGMYVLQLRIDDTVSSRLIMHNQ